jgi:hypothetical protein
MAIPRSSRLDLRIMEALGLWIVAIAVGAALAATPPARAQSRHPYLVSLRTEWGGSLAQMLDFMDESRKAGLTESQLAYLQKLVDSEREWLEKRQQGDKDPEAGDI